MSGEYRAPYKAESVLIVTLLAVAAAAGVALFFVMKNFVEKTKREEGYGSTFVIIGGGIALLIFIVILIVVFGVGIKNVKKGFLCKYTANDETFTATIGGDLHVIQYREVTNVHFKPRSSMGKIRGYDVTIKVNGRDEVYSVCSDGYLSPNATPFFIIQERLDIIRRQKSPVQENTARSDTRGITRAEIERAKTGSINAMDRMAHLLGETSNMPELSADDTPAARAVAEVEKMITGGASGANYYTDNMGRQHSMDTVQSQGSFYVKPSAGVLAVFTVGITIVSGVAAFLLSSMLFGLFITPILDRMPIKDQGTIITVAEIAITAVVMILAFLLTITRVHGPLHSYKADGRGFFVTIKGKGQEQILYKDVLSVDYKRTKLLWGKRGYNVDILTTYGVVHYDYVFPRFNQSIALQNLPFDVIKRNIPKRDDEQL